MEITYKIQKNGVCYTEVQAARLGALGYPNFIICRISKRVHKKVRRGECLAAANTLSEVHLRPVGEGGGGSGRCMYIPLSE